MYRSLTSIELDIKSLGYDPTSLRWNELLVEREDHQKFWTEVHGLTIAPDYLKNEARRREGLRRYLRVESLSLADAFLISTGLEKLAKLSHEHDNVDEGIRILRDFLRLEEGKPVTRPVRLADFKWTLEARKGLELYEEMDLPEGGMFSQLFDEHDYRDHKDGLRFEWFCNFKDGIEDLEEFAKMFPERTPMQSVQQLRECILPVVNSVGEDFSHGVEASIRFPIEFLQKRKLINPFINDHKVLDHQLL